MTLLPARICAGLYADMTAEEYFADPCAQPSLNQSSIPDLLDRSPMHFAYGHPRLNPYGGPGADTTKAQWLGSAVHRIALGRGRELSIIRYPDYISKSARDARDLAIANNRIPVLEHEHVKACDMAEILRRQIDEELGGAEYLTEVVLIWEEHTVHGPIWCRAMLDVFCYERAIIMDPKALRIPATAKAFGRTAADSGYDGQAVFYRRGVSQVFPELAGDLKFVNLVVESSPPHGAQAFELDEDSRTTAETRVAQGMERFAYCLHNRQWPGYPKGIQTASTPQYYRNQIANG